MNNFVFLQMPKREAMFGVVGLCRLSGHYRMWHESFKEFFINNILKILIVLKIKLNKAFL